MPALCTYLGAFSWKWAGAFRGGAMAAFCERIIHVIGMMCLWSFCVHEPLTNLKLLIIDSGGTVISPRYLFYFWHLHPAALSVLWFGDDLKWWASWLGVVCVWCFTYSDGSGKSWRSQVFSKHGAGWGQVVFSRSVEMPVSGWNFPGEWFRLRFGLDWRLNGFWRGVFLSWVIVVAGW